MDTIQRCRIVLSILQEHCLQSSVRWYSNSRIHLIHRLSDLIQNNDLQKIHLTDFNPNLREQYPSMFFFSLLHSVNLSTEYIIARDQFYKGQFVSAIQTVESVAGFDSNPSFLFLWGYSYYMVGLLFMSISSCSSPFSNENCLLITNPFRNPN